MRTTARRAKFYGISGAPLRAATFAAGITAFATSATALSACAPAAAGDAATSAFSSATGVVRAMSFDGVVYVDRGASDDDTLRAVQDQTISAMGPLKEANTSVNSALLRAVDPSAFVKDDVTVVDPNDASFAPKPMTRVRYTYRDVAAMPAAKLGLASLDIALMGTGYDDGDRRARILEACTANDDDAKEYPIWDGFDPARATCQAAIAAEQTKIDADTAAIAAAATDPAATDDPAAATDPSATAAPPADAAPRVARSEVERLLRPAVVRFEAGQVSQTKPTYPQYDRLYRGGVVDGQLTIALVFGYLDNASPYPSDDGRYPRWLRSLRMLFQAHPGFALATNDRAVAPLGDLAALTPAGVSLAGAKFDDVIRWELDKTGLPAGVTAANEAQFHHELSAALAKHWITFALPTTATIAGASAPLTIQLDTYFGTKNPETDAFTWAFANADVVAYSGHSQLGEGSLVASNYTSLSPAYQLFFFDSCMSFNYYTQSYFQLKPGGARDLQIVANGIEDQSYSGALAEAQFLNGLLDGKTESYKSLFDLAKSPDPTEYDGVGPDPLRVVVGDEASTYDPAATPITLGAGP